MRPLAEVIDTGRVGRKVIDKGAIGMHSATLGRKCKTSSMKRVDQGRPNRYSEAHASPKPLMLADRGEYGQKKQTHGSTYAVAQRWRRPSVCLGSCPLLSVFNDSLRLNISENYADYCHRKYLRYKGSTQLSNVSEEFEGAHGHFRLSNLAWRFVI